MIVTIGSIFSGVLVGIIANLLTPYIKKKFQPKIKIKQKPTITNIQPESKNDQSIETWREFNKRKLCNNLVAIFFYGASYWVLFYAFFMPLSFYSFPDGINVNLTNSKIPINYIINEKNIYIICMVLAIFTFFILIPFIKYLTNRLCGFLWKYIEITQLKYNAIFLLITFFMSTFLMGNIHYLLHIDATWWNSIKYYLLILPALVFVAFAAGKRGLY